MAQPGKVQCPLSIGYGRLDGTPRPWASAPTPMDPKTRQGLHTLGVSGLPLPGTSAGVLTFTGPGNCVAHYARKRGRHGYDPAGGTVPQLV